MRAPPEPARPRWGASLAVHGIAIGLACGWGSGRPVVPALAPAVGWQVTVEGPVPAAEPWVHEPVEDPPMLDDEPFRATPMPEEVSVEPPAGDLVLARNARVALLPTNPEDWLVVVRKVLPAVVDEPPEPLRERVADADARRTVVPSAIEQRNTPPVYPRRALRLGIEGTVVLAVVVQADGRVGTCVVRRSSGSRLLDRAAVRAVRGWVFRDGPGLVELPVVFRLAARR